jgi:hypothetical protein
MASRRSNFHRPACDFSNGFGSSTAKSDNEILPLLPGNWAEQAPTPRFMGLAGRSSTDPEAAQIKGQNLTGEG